jgi:hypothetical protein
MSSPRVRTLEDLKLQRRWVLWRLIHKPGTPKPTKIPFQVNGKMARTNDPATWATHADCEAVVSQFSGIGLVLGEVDGVSVWGVDIDNCCDAVTGKFTPESREVVIGLDSYSEYSPSGTGCHVFGIGPLPGDGEPVVRPHPGCKQIEIKGRSYKGRGFYFTFSGRHLSKTPRDLMHRQKEITVLYNRVQTMPTKTGSKGVTVRITSDEETRYKQLMAGDMSDYDDNHSVADMALVSILAKRHHNNAFLIDQEFCKSGLYRQKWDRLDYKWSTIGKVIKGEPVFDDADDALMEDDGVDEYLVDALGKGHEGWFPKGDVSLIGGSSGSGKTYWVMTLLEKVRGGADVWGHKAIARDYRVVMHDRGQKGMRRTLDALGLSVEARQRVIRLTSKQQSLQPAEVLEAAIDKNPGAEAWFIEGLDMWFPNTIKMEVVAPIMDGLQRLATRRNVAVIATVGAPKEKTAERRDTERYHGRDALFGSSALARKCETVVLISKTDMADENSPRQYSVLPRNGRAERFWMTFACGKLIVVDPPPPKEQGIPGRKPAKGGLLKLNIWAKFKPGERVVYSHELGVSRAFYYDWVKIAVAEGVMEQRDGVYYRTTLEAQRTE